MMKSDEIILDSKSGISIEEQKEILAKINGIAEKNRRSLAQGIGVKSGEKPVIKAKKSTAVFPLIVNIVAVAILAGGGFFLVSFNGRMDAQIKTGTAVYNHMERTLIDEIRKDTAAKIAAKESEISLISSRLEEVDVQLMRLFSTNQELTAEQLAAQEGLLALQNTYRADLSNLREERSQILEDSRSREARLRSQLDERTKEFAAAQESSSRELDSAMSELERLTGEQERIAAIDAQLAGSLPAVSAFIQNGNYNQAAQAVTNMRYLFNDSAFASARAYQSKREFYNNAINFMELLINEGQKNSISFAITSQNLQSQNTRLEDTISQMQGDIESFSADNESMTRRIAELEQTVSSLRTTNTSQQAAIAEHTQTITGLRSTNASQQTIIAERERTIRTLEADKTELNQTITGLRSANSTQQTANAELTQTVARLRSTNESQAQEITNLRSQIDELRKEQ